MYINHDRKVRVQQGKERVEASKEQRTEDVQWNSGPKWQNIAQELGTTLLVNHIFNWTTTYIYIYRYI